ncbi:hypothetical protein AXE65_12765 [Ventosimonas gracilis]|uniref:Uncharacterized protein n=1 Tax=Ventosimonas gracilis TaxID=1680762 RepID=A0A139SVU8_9GAMM|nr:hypothetical protein [Ventosimonas gracilis]KXU38561.1 hypothetical protein AXE65_12765 [Ventosimonas gracilis]
MKQQKTDQTEKALINSPATPVIKAASIHCNKAKRDCIRCSKRSILVNQSKLDSHYTTEFVCVIKMMERAIDVFNRPDILDYEIYNSFSRQLMACNEEIGKNEYLTARSEERLTSGYLILLRKASLIKG